MASHRRPRLGRTRALLSLGLLAGFSAVTTSAYWLDTASFSAGTVETGALHVDLAGNNRVKPESIAFPGLSLAAMTPGSNRAAVIAVTNNSRGAASFSYRVQAGTGGTTLGTTLQLTVRRGGTSNGTTCSGGVLVGSANAALNGFDQPAGAVLAPTQAHSLCVQVTLPASPAVPPSSSTLVTFTFPATQVP